jgi:hypothetical protein
VRMPDRRPASRAIARASHYDYETGRTVRSCSPGTMRRAPPADRDPVKLSPTRRAPSSPRASLADSGLEVAPRLAHFPPLDGRPLPKSNKPQMLTPVCVRVATQAVPPCRFNATASSFAGIQLVALAHMHRDNAVVVRAGKRRRDDQREPGIHSPRMGRHKRRGLDSRKRRLRLAIPTAGQHRPAVHRLADRKGYIAPSREANSR